MAEELKGIVRIAGADILGTKPIYAGLLKVKGVSYAFSNAICNALGFEKNTKIGSLSTDQLSKVESMIKSPSNLPSFLLNRRKQFETGLDAHLSFSDLKLAVEFDIKRMKKIKSYKGIRHAMGQPVRGQSTKSHFRTGKALGVKKKKKGKKG